MILPCDKGIDPVPTTHFQPVLNGAPSVGVVRKVFNPYHEQRGDQTHVNHDGNAVLIAT